MSSQIQIAEEYAKNYNNKIENIRNSTTYENFKAINVFKTIIPKVEGDIEFPPVTIKEIKIQ